MSTPQDTGVQGLQGTHTVRYFQPIHRFTFTALCRNMEQNDDNIARVFVELIVLRNEISAQWPREYGR